MSQTPTQNPFFRPKPEDKSSNISNNNTNDPLKKSFSTTTQPTQQNTTNPFTKTNIPQPTFAPRTSIRQPLGSKIATPSQNTQQQQSNFAPQKPEFPKPQGSTPTTPRPFIPPKPTAVPRSPLFQHGNKDGQTHRQFIFEKPSQKLSPISTSPFRNDLTITDEEFTLIRDYIYEKCGIFIAENRKYLVENRLSNRLKELGLKNYNEYYNLLRYDSTSKEELNKLFEVMTTNETSFFRNPPQLEIFKNIVLARVIDNCRKIGIKKIRIWSAGCSTGEEPYTLSIILHEVLASELKSWDIKITANDLSTAVLAAAKKGIYNEYAIRTTPKEILEKYFTKDGNVYKISEEIKKLVSFGQINLSDKDQLKKVERSQIVFCRNVIIYFDDEMKRKVIGAFYDNLEPNGALLIGHSESLHNISRAFHLENHKGTIVYRKIS